MLNMSQAVENWNKIGNNKVNYGVAKTFLLAVFAGIAIALAGFGSVIGNAFGDKLEGAAIFPIGLIMIVLVGAELFTGNCLLIVPLINKKIGILRLLRNWIIVFVGNFAGALLVTWLLYACGLFSPNQITSSLQTIATGKLSGGFLALFIRGILCNLLVCIAVWMASCTDNFIGKILGVFFPIFLFVMCGFEHSIANMFYLPAQIFASGNVSWADFLTVNLLPVTLGNIVGGCFFGGLMAVCVKLK